MNEKYKKLMEQHGGYIPFTVLGGKHRTHPLAKRTTRYRRNNKTIRTRPKFIINSGKYTPGTIIRSNDVLYYLNNTRQWLRI